MGKEAGQKRKSWNLSVPLLNNLITIKHMEENIYDQSIMAGIEPDTHFLQEVEVKYTPREDLKISEAIRVPEEAYNYIRPLFLPFVSHHEEVWMLLLNPAMKITGMSQIAKGGD